MCPRHDVQLGKQLHHCKSPALFRDAYEDTNIQKGLITPPMISSLGFGTYIFFAAFCLIALVWVWFFIPETNGRTLEQMDFVFGDNQTTHEKDRRKRIEQEMMQNVDQKINLDMGRSG